MFVVDKLKTQSDIVGIISEADTWLSFGSHNEGVNAFASITEKDRLISKRRIANRAGGVEIPNME
jgi:hypothetical protein